MWWDSDDFEKFNDDCKEPARQSEDKSAGQAAPRNEKKHGVLGLEGLTCDKMSESEIKTNKGGTRSSREFRNGERRLQRCGGRRRLVSIKETVQRVNERHGSCLQPNTSITQSIRSNNSSRLNFDLQEMLTQKVEESRRRFSFISIDHVSASACDTEAYTCSINCKGKKSPDHENEAAEFLESLQQQDQQQQQQQQQRQQHPRSSLVDLALFDIEEQRRRLAMFEELAANSLVNDSVIATTTTTTSSSSPVGAPASQPEETPQAFPTEMIEIAPGIELPLRSSGETCQAILEGRIVVTTCCSCHTELVCIEDAGLVVCSDCWTFSPVDQNVATLSASLVPGNADIQTSISIGIKAADIFEWVDNRNNNNNEDVFKTDFQSVFDWVEAQIQNQSES